ncbi:6303_t:CDS:1, partial [Acaulospora colombiana]
MGNSISDNSPADNDPSNQLNAQYNFNPQLKEHNPADTSQTTSINNTKGKHNRSNSNTEHINTS